MSQLCRANPCCGEFYGGCAVPLPQDASGFPGRNVEYAKEIEAGAKNTREAEAMRKENAQ